MASSSNADLVKRLSQLLKKVPVAEQDTILVTCNLREGQNRSIQVPITSSVLSEDHEEEEPVTPLIRKRKTTAQEGSRKGRKRSSCCREGSQGTGTGEQNELKEMMNELRNIYDETLFWIKKLIAKLSEGQGEGTSGTGPGGA